MFRNYLDTNERALQSGGRAIPIHVFAASRNQFLRALQRFFRAIDIDLFGALRGLRQDGDAIRQYFRKVIDSLPSVETSPDFAKLTQREQEILNLLSKGYVDKEIAEALRRDQWRMARKNAQVSVGAG